MSSYRVPPTPMYVIKRGDYYLTAQAYGWTLFRAYAAVFESRAVAQTFLQDFPQEFEGAELVPYVEEGRVTL